MVRLLAILWVSLWLLAGSPAIGWGKDALPVEPDLNSRVDELYDEAMESIDDYSVEVMISLELVIAGSSFDRNAHSGPDPSW